MACSLRCSQLQVSCVVWAITRGAWDQGTKSPTSLWMILMINFSPHVLFGYRIKLLALQWNIICPSLEDLDVCFWTIYQMESAICCIMLDFEHRQIIFQSRKQAWFWRNIHYRACFCRTLENSARRGWGWERIRGDTALRSMTALHQVQVLDCEGWAMLERLVRMQNFDLKG